MSCVMLLQCHVLCPRRDSPVPHKVRSWTLGYARVASVVCHGLHGIPSLMLSEAVNPEEALCKTVAIKRQLGLYKPGIIRTKMDRNLQWSLEALGTLSSSLRSPQKLETYLLPQGHSNYCPHLPRTSLGFSTGCLSCQDIHPS